MKTKDLQTLEKQEKIIALGVKKIETAEKRIEKEEELILAAEKNILKFSKGNPFKSVSAGRSMGWRSMDVFRIFFDRKIARHKLVAGIVGTVAMVLTWRGVWHTADELPIISYSLVSLLIGIFLLWVVRKYTD